MSDIQTFLIEDSRIANVTDQMSVAVKDGPASSTRQSYTASSTSSSSALFNVNVPSENTLISRDIRVKTTLYFWYEVDMDDNVGQDIVNGAVCAFPLNSLCSGASLTINNAKVGVQSQDVMNIILKQYDQREISKHIQTTPSYVDKYWAQPGAALAVNSPLNGYQYAEMDSNVVGRGGYEFNVQVDYKTQAAGNAITNLAAVDGRFVHAAGQALDDKYRVQVTLTVTEPILCLHPLQFMNDDGAAFLGVNNLELLLTINDAKNLWCQKGNIISDFGRGVNEYAGFTNANLTQTTNPFKDSETEIQVNYLSLHPSQYAKMNTKNVLPTLDYSPFITTCSATNPAAQKTQTCNFISLSQIPDKIYVQVRIPYNNQNQYNSNNLGARIDTVTVTFNNKSGLLSEMSTYQLYEMSKRNGNTQTWAEFNGQIRTANSLYSQDGQTGSPILQASLGSIVIIDPVLDLGLSDFLSSGSLGQYGLQIKVTYTNTSGYFLSSTGAASTQDVPFEVAVICANSGLIVTSQGSSAMMTGLLTKSMVLSAKEKEGDLNYEDLAEMSGGAPHRGALTNIGNIMKKKFKGMRAGYVRSGGHYAHSGGAREHDKLEKYM